MMLAVQPCSPSLSSFPYLSGPLPSPHTPRRTPAGLVPPIDTTVANDMPHSNPAENLRSKTTSVFNALGSYADRIKDANGKAVTIKSSSPGTPAPSPKPSQSNMATSNGAPRSRQSKAENGKRSQDEKSDEDGSWETVPTKGQRAKPEVKEKRSAANTSRNWRERPSKDDDETSKRSASRASRKSPASANTATATPTSAPGPAAEKDKERPVPKPAVPSVTKPAWGAIAVAPAASLSAATANASSAQTSTSGPGRSSLGKGAEVPAPAESSTARASTASPNNSVSNETASTTTAVTTASATTKVDAEEEGSWRARPSQTKPQEQEAEEKVKPVSKPTAPPPTVNAWDLRKKAAQPAPAAARIASTSSLVNGSSSASAPQSAVGPKPGQSAASSPVTGKEEGRSNLVNGDAKVDENAKAQSSVPKKKKKPTSEPTTAVASMADPSLWPDVAQAAVVAKKEDDKKDKLREKKDGDQASIAAEETGTVGKKHKWKSIPAAELQAAADEQAESVRRQAAAKKRMAKVEGSTNQAPSVKPKARKSSLEKGKAVVPGANGDVRLPPSATGGVRGQQPIKPVFGSVGPSSEAGSLGLEQIKDLPHASSAPMSRQASAQSHASPSRLSTHLPSPGRIVNHLDAVGGPQSKQMSGASSAPVSNASFPHSNGTGSQTVPRPPRGRDARGSFSSRGRGGYRGSGVKGFTSPVMAANGLPIDSAAAYARGYGVGYSYFPVNAIPMAGLAQYAQGQQVTYDPSQAQYNLQAYSRGAAPPPPMPQTVVANIDPHRFYILGQVEYYFSMQNLAMDFFLRQQMDSEGWIDISMIASFNRLKSLTPDVNMVKEVMGLSSLLEVREDKVRLAGQESKRWVLPNAPTSIFPPDPISADDKSTPETLPSSEHPDISDMALELAGLGMEDLAGSNAPKYPAGTAGVEGALMKNSIPSSAASMSNGDVSVDKVDEVDDTPATSTSGDDAEEGKRVAGHRGPGQ